MRLWSLHPKYLDSKGLVALWREGLLARKVLLGKTKGYKNHPQLIRFKNHKNPINAIDTYLINVYLESKLRNYHFNRSKIGNKFTEELLDVTETQLIYELEHLRIKLETRDHDRYLELKNITIPDPNPFFIMVDGDIETWEIQKES
ncbi:MAG: pyrimidine dimer DNA glycosylase/endonuclease V [Methanobacterium sp. ERen5]|nr:MAG: pyrimidine dimer DNA glycosylase/endonuclease V [Methanobacterium sp. ERen5]